MSLFEFENIKDHHFPMEMVSLTEYESEHTKLCIGDTFMAVRKQTLGRNDHSIIDQFGHPHYYLNCVIL